MLEPSSGTKEKWWPKQTGEKSRNSLGKSTTVLTINKPAIKSITPIKCSNGSRTGRSDPSLTTREKALMKQNVELKKENSELIKLLKKSKEVIKDEIGKYKAENFLMKRFAEASWPYVEAKLEEKLKDEVKPLIAISKESIGKMNSNTTNHTDHFSAEKSKSNRDEIDNLRLKLAEKESETLSLQRELNRTRLENEMISKYLKFSQSHKFGIPSPTKKPKEILPVDSSNVGSEADEDEVEWIKKSEKERNGPTVIAGFIKSLTLQ